MQIHEKSQVEFPVSKFPIDVANAALRDAKSVRERYILRRFQMSRHVAALVAERAFHVEARR